MNEADNSADRHEALLERSWAGDWERLPVADARFTRRPMTEQVTVRIASGAVEAVKSIAHRKALPYHALVRSWIVAALDKPQVPDWHVQDADERAAANRQLNIKLSPTDLARLKRTAHDLGQPYHRLTRLWLYDALTRERAQVPDLPSTPGISLTEVLLLLLHARGPHGQLDEPIRGDTRLVKLLFVASKRLGKGPADLFYAYNYGPFSPDAYDARDALATEGLLDQAAPDSDAMPTFEAMMSVVRSKGQSQKSVPIYRLNPEGATRARRLVSAVPTAAEILQVVEAIKSDYGRLSDNELVDRVYAEYPEYTDRSLIIGEVRERSQRRTEK
jgi:predicted DNA binding CopG/RHH family protein